MTLTSAPRAKGGSGWSYHINAAKVGFSLSGCIVTMETKFLQKDEKFCFFNPNSSALVKLICHTRLRFSCQFLLDNSCQVT